MGSTLWNSLKAGEKQPPTNIVNADVIVVEETQDGSSTTKRTVTDTTPRAGERVRFKPVDALDHRMSAKQISEAPPSDNFDLVGDDISAPPAARTGSAGRPRLHSNNAEKQRAYRARKTNGQA